MKFKSLLICLCASILLVSCKKDDNLFTTPAADSLRITPKTYSLVENFEAGKKTAYAAADVTVNSGSWNFDNALIGNIAGDAKNGSWSVRLKNPGSIKMNYDVSGVAKLVFKHGKYGSDGAVTWQLLISRDGGKTYSQLGSDYVENNNVLVTDSVNIATTGPVRFQFKNTTAVVANKDFRMNLDDITIKGFGDPGVTPSDTAPDDGGSTTGGSTGTAATPRGVTIGADAPPATGDNSNLLFGNPSTASSVSAENFLIDQGYYVESYSKTRGTPNWVSWHLDKSNTTNATDRLDNFAAYSGLPSGYFQVQNISYQGSGFDRGHNCPSADRTSSTAANSATFLMTNMIPQAPQNNQQTWNNLEGYLRTQVTAGNEVYIVMGSYGVGGVGSNSAATVNTIANGNVTVPSNVWKVAVIIPAGNSDLIRAGNASAVRVIAVNTPNINSIDVDWKKYITTVRSIETAVGNGFNLLSALPQSLQDAVETKADAGI